ncbi:MAG: hypothetical protein ACOX5M_05120 [Bacillota bacterium]|jgi:hypothetical protein
MFIPEVMSGLIGDPNKEFSLRQTLRMKESHMNKRKLGMTGLMVSENGSYKVLPG